MGFGLLYRTGHFTLLKGECTCLPYELLLPKDDQKVMREPELAAKDKGRNSCIDSILRYNGKKERKRLPFCFTFESAHPKY